MKAAAWAPARSRRTRKRGQRPRSLGSDRHAAPRQSQDEWVAESVRQQQPGELPAGIGAVFKERFGFGTGRKVVFDAHCRKPGEENEAVDAVLESLRPNGLV